MEFIRGESREKTLLLPERVEDYVDGDNPVRVIDAYINSLNMAELGFSKSEPNDTGRPMDNPHDLLKLYVYGYMNRIRSSRRLEKESKRNLEVLWLLGKLSPDHKTIANFRRDNPAALKKVFRHFVRLCVRMGLYGKELAAIDGSKFKAVNSRKRNYTGQQIEEKIAKITAKTEGYLSWLERDDAAEGAAGGEKSKEEIARIISSLQRHKQRYEGYAAELERTGETQKSLTDADSRLMQGNGKMDVSYNVQTAVDAKHKLLVEFEVTNQGNDKNLITPMGERAREMSGTERMAVVVDGGYESIQDILSAMGKGLDVHVAGTDFDVCVPAEGEQNEIHAHHNGRCVYIGERNIVLCPMGKVLYPVSHKKGRKQEKGKGVGVFYHYGACQQCTQKCTKDARGRYRHQVPMEQGHFSKEYNDERLTVRQIRIKPDKALIAQRKSIAEHPFGTVKRGMDAGYCLMKGLTKVRGEYSLTFLAYNIKRVINILGWGKLKEKIA